MSGFAAGERNRRVPIPRIVQPARLIADWLDENPLLAYQDCWHAITRSVDLIDSHLDLSFALAPLRTCPLTLERFLPISDELKRMSQLSGINSTTAAGVAYVASAIRDMEPALWPRATHWAAAYGYIRISIRDLGYRLGGDCIARDDLMQEPELFLFAKPYLQLRDTLAEIMKIA